MLHKKILLCILIISFFITLPIVAMEAPSSTPLALSPLDEALFDAISRKNELGEIRQLIAQGANLNAQPIHHKETPLYHAIEYDNNIKIIEALITPENINLGQIVGLTPLHEAAKKNNLKAVHLLIQRGAHKNALDKWGQSPLYRALEQKADVNVIKEVITPENLNLRQIAGSTPLAQALEKKYSDDVIKLLIESGAEITEKILNDFSEILTRLATQVTAEEMQHIIPGFLSLKKTTEALPGTFDALVRAKIKNQMLNDVIDEKLALAHKYKLKVPDQELRDLIWANMRRELSKKKQSSDKRDSL